MTRRARLLEVLRALFHELRTEQVTFLAGSIAYHAFVSLLPAALLAVVILSTVGGGSQEAVTSLVAAAVTRGAAEALLRELERAGRSRGLSVAGIAVLLWGTLRVFRGLDAAFSAVYETETNNGFVDQFVDGAMVLVAVTGGVVVATLVVDLLPGGEGVVGRLIERLVVIAGLAVTLLPMYYVFPDTDVTVIEVLPGTVVAAVGLALGESAFSLYVVWSGSQPNASVVAGLVVFLTWLYVSGLILLIGAATNAVLSNRSEDVTLDPVIGGVSPGSSRTEPRASSDAVEAALEGLGHPPETVEWVEGANGVRLELRWDDTTE